MTQQQRLHAESYHFGHEKGRRTEYRRIRRMIVSMRVSTLIHANDAHTRGQRDALTQLLDYIAPKARKAKR